MYPRFGPKFAHRKQVVGTERTEHTSGNHCCFYFEAKLYHGRAIKAVQLAYDHGGKATCVTTPSFMCSLFGTRDRKAQRTLQLLSKDCFSEKPLFLTWVCLKIDLPTCLVSFAFRMNTNQNRVASNNDTPKRSRNMNLAALSGIRIVRNIKSQEIFWQPRSSFVSGWEPSFSKLILSPLVS